MQVLLRYNLLAGLLCLVMNRPYQYYQYIPIATYWFTCCFITLALPPHITAASCQGKVPSLGSLDCRSQIPLVAANQLHYLYMVIKFVGFFAVISVLYLSEVSFIPQLATIQEAYSLHP